MLYQKMYTSIFMLFFYASYMQASQYAHSTLVDNVKREELIVNAIAQKNEYSVDYDDVIACANEMAHMPEAHITQVVQGALDLAKVYKSEKVALNHLLFALTLHPAYKNYKQKIQPFMVTFLLDHYEKIYNLTLTVSQRNHLARMMQELSYPEIQALFKRINNKIFLGNLNEVTPSTVINTFEQFTYQSSNQASIETSVPASSLKPELVSPLTAKFIKIKVKSQFDSDGGGVASCGYHAFKNGIALASEKKRTSLFTDASFITKHFSTEQGPWRAALIRLRSNEYNAHTWYNLFLLSLKGQRVFFAHNELQPTSTLAYALKFNHGSISFVPSSTESDLLQQERCLLINLLPQMVTKAQRLGKSDITAQELSSLISQVLSEKALVEQNPLYTSLNTAEKIAQHFNFPPTSPDTHDNKPISYYLADAAGKDQFLIDPAQHRPGLKGDWLSSKELYTLFANAQRTQNYLSSIPLICIEDVTKNNIQQQINVLDEKLTRLHAQLLDQTSSCKALLIINTGGHWVACFVNKQRKQVTYTIADSADSTSTINPIILHILNAISSPIAINAACGENGDIYNLDATHKQNNSNLLIPKTSLADFAGTIPEHIQEYITLLSNSNSPQTAGIQLPTMLLLYGEPGVGKTKLAEAIAHETKRTFISISASKLFKKYYGQAQEALTSLFDTARSQKTPDGSCAPAIIFIDEIEAILADDTDDRVRKDLRHILNIELDKNDRSICCIGATNEFNSIDTTTLTRAVPIEILPPNLAQREAIIKHYLAKAKANLTSEFIKTLANSTANFNARDLMMLCQKALIHQFYKKDPELTQQHYEYALGYMKTEKEKYLKARADRLPQGPSKLSQIGSFACNISQVVLNAYISAKVNNYVSVKAVKNVEETCNAPKKHT